MRRAHLVAAFVAFAALCSGVSALSVWHDRTATLLQAQREVTATARLLDEHASRAIESGDAVLQQLVDMLGAWDLRDPEKGQSLWNTLRARTYRMPQVGAAWVVDAQGRIALDSREFPAQPLDLSQHDYVRAHRGGARGLYVSPAEMGVRTGQERFTLSRALRDADDHVQAVAVFAIHGTYFSRLYGEAGWGTEAKLALFTADRERLAAWPPDSAVNPPAGAWPQPWDPSDAPAVIEDTHITAARRLTAYPVVVVASRPLDEVLAGWRERTAWTAAIGGGLLGGALLLFLYALASLRREEDTRFALLRANQSLDERVRRRTEELESALRVAETANLAKMKVLATVSHDLRQPLQGVAAFHELLLKDTTNPELRRLGGMATASLQAGQRLLDDLLTLSRLEAGVMPVEVGPLALGPVLEQLAAELRAEGEAKGLRLTVVPTGAWVRSDPARLQPILRNLLSNAVKYTARGGVVVGVRRRGDRVRVEVWDSGPGIPDSELATIWEEFYQIGNPARDGSRGAGLGLSIVERTARLLDHPLEVRSRVGRGSVFAVSLPRTVPPAAPAPAAGVSAPGTTGGPLSGRLILVVEDDPLQRSSLTLLVEHAGATVVAADSFDAALAMTRATLRLPSAVLSDYRLPGGTDGLSGIQGLRRAFGTALPAVLLTGELSAEVARAAKAAGCTVLTKPAPPARILGALAELAVVEEVA
ncbi:ATP-binding protein [Azospirillum sp. sgz302134]